MKIKVWVVTTCIPERGEGPCLPSVFGTEAEAEAYADEMLREEWEQYGPIDEEADDGTVLPYPGHWRDANDEIKRRIGDGSWGEWQITSHEIEIGRLVAVVEGGMLSAVVTDGPVAGQAVDTIDYDVDGADENELAKIRQADGSEVAAYVGRIEIEREEIVLPAPQRSRDGYRLAQNLHANVGYFVRPDDNRSFSPVAVYPTPDAAWAAFDAEEC